ncbi:hypothetical protein BpHYR1_028369 [Brachionus plicatilis]|uniref:Uncharacterized protein n=1 Tax=Brachionus plicatilis TaxID=10195 RepID=A0A3M7T6D2_BRAPC|nr:hypothetical protein BpHYR1_028369 [Brachionus plicatilis]
MKSIAIDSNFMYNIFVLIILSEKAFNQDGLNNCATGINKRDNKLNKKQTRFQKIYANHFCKNYKNGHSLVINLQNNPYLKRMKLFPLFAPCSAYDPINKVMVIIFFIFILSQSQINQNS